MAHGFAHAKLHSGYTHKTQTHSNIALYQYCSFSAIIQHNPDIRSPRFIKKEILISISWRMRDVREIRTFLYIRKQADKRAHCVEGAVCYIVVLINLSIYTSNCITPTLTLCNIYNIALYEYILYTHFVSLNVYNDRRAYKQSPIEKRGWNCLPCAPFALEIDRYPLGKLKTISYM